MLSLVYLCKLFSRKLPPSQSLTPDLSLHCGKARRSGLQHRYDINTEMQLHAIPFMAELAPFSRTCRVHIQPVD
jgi:hypothetical protein